MLQVAETLIQRLSAFFAVWSLEKNSFLSVIWLPNSQLWIIIMEQPLLPYANCCSLTFLTSRLPEAQLQGWVPKHHQKLTGSWTRILQIPLQCCNPLKAPPSNFKPWLLDSFDLLSCSSELRKIYTMTHLMICLAVFSK